MCVCVSFCAQRRFSFNEHALAQVGVNISGDASKLRRDCGVSL